MCICCNLLTGSHKYSFIYRKNMAVIFTIMLMFIKKGKDMNKAVFYKDIVHYEINI